MRERNRFENEIALLGALPEPENLVGLSEPGTLSDSCAKLLKNTRVAVVGGGLAGLMAARSLGRHGVSVTVFEARPKVGGRVMSNHKFSRGRITEEGAELIGTFHTKWLSLAREYGLSMINRMSAELYHREGLAVKLTLDRPLSTQEFLDLDAAAHKVMRAIAENARDWISHPSEPWRQPRQSQPDVVTLDSESVENALQQRYAVIKGSPLWKMLEFTLVNNEVARFDKMNFLGLLCKVKAGQGEQFGLPNGNLMGYWEDLETFRCANGCQKLAEKMVDEIKSKYKGKVYPGMAVIGIGLTSSGVLLSWKKVVKPSGQLDTRLPFIADYDYVILAVPPSVWKGVSVTTGTLSKDRKSITNSQIIDLGQAVGLMSMGPAVKFFTDLKERFWFKEKPPAAPYGGALTLGQVWEGTDNQTIVDPSVAKQGIVLSVFAGPVVPGPGGAFRPPTADECKTGLQSLYAGYKTNAVATLLTDWPKEPFIMTGYASPGKGEVLTIGRKLGQPFPSPTGRLFFAGEHTQMDSFGYMEGALRSGERAADKLMVRICNPPSGEPHIV